ncbi:MAG: NAD-dependent epimerase/dehydratase family protein, partial [Firmicutes bacterium]|nr:NAD-dependent epimerase/dehydratase family protein [Bacillota bacterium]
QYILLSTADVYDRSIRTSKDETAPLQDHMGDCMAADYMWKKRNLEAEAAMICGDLGIGLTVIRPAFIYGPFNYAPRESFFIEKIIKQQPIPVPVDSDSEWNCVFVTDIARALCACIENQNVSSGQAYNLSAPEVITYDRFIGILREVSDRPFETYGITVSEVLEKNIPLPFPLTAEESERYTGSKICRDLGVEYSPVKVGMQKAFNAFRSVYER